MFLGSSPERAAVANLLSGLCFSPCLWLLSTLGKCILSALSCVFVILIEFSLHVNSQQACSEQKSANGGEEEQCYLALILGDVLSRLPAWVFAQYS